MQKLYVFKEIKLMVITNETPYKKKYKQRCVFHFSYHQERLTSQKSSFFLILETSLVFLVTILCLTCQNKTFFWFNLCSEFFCASHLYILILDTLYIKFWYFGHLANCFFNEFLIGEFVQGTFLKVRLLLRNIL